MSKYTTDKKTKTNGPMRVKTLIIILLEIWQFGLSSKIFFLLPQLPYYFEGIFPREKLRSLTVSLT